MQLNVAEPALHELQTYHHKLLELKSKADSEGVLAPHLFAFFSQQVTNEPATTIAQFIHIRKQLHDLTQYTIQFDRYKKAVAGFFATYPINSNSNYEQYRRYLFINNLSRRLFTDFSAGNYWQGSIQNSVDLLLSHIARFVQQEGLLTKEQHNKTLPALQQLLIFKPLEQETTATALHALKEYMKGFFPDEIAFTLSRQRLSSIANGYFMLSAQELKDVAVGKTNPLTPLLTQLKTALKSHNHRQISLVLNKLANFIPPAKITNPTNGSNTRFKVVNIQGVALPNSKVELILNNTARFTTQTNEQGVFDFDKIELLAGQNTLQCHNPQYDFLYPLIPVHILVFIATYPFMGRIDPVTQQPFTEADLESIWRCASCKNYMYDYCIADNDGICVILKCNSKIFYTHTQKEFWIA